uniref:Uncharacterized protein n=1 Tax=Salix viminalis TaxID=40686 RepID=A0A6N2N2R0_SALVM
MENNSSAPPVAGLPLGLPDSILTMLDEVGCAAGVLKSSEEEDAIYDDTAFPMLRRWDGLPCSRRFGSLLLVIEDNNVEQI